MAIAGPFSARQTLARLVEERLVTLHTQCPGTIVAWDPAKQRADVRPMLKTRRYDESDEPVDESQPVIPSVPVRFAGNADWESIHGVKVGDQCWIEWSEGSLEDWSQNGEEAPGNDFKRFGYSDAVATIGIRDFAHAREACPQHQMRIGAVDGPKITLDLNNLSIELSALNEIKLAAGARISIEAPTVFINGRFVDLNAGDI